jgi:hypothetical protein
MSIACSGSAALAPAISLLAVAVLSLGFAIIYSGLQFLGAKQLPPPPAGMSDANKAGFEIGVKIGLYGTPIVTTLWPVLILPGAIQMIRLRTRWLAITSSVVALLPCSPGCLLGVPFGIWALVALNKQEVKDAFR